jgi:hypothetical protein
MSARGSVLVPGRRDPPRPKPGPPGAPPGSHGTAAVACLQDCRGTELDAHLAECRTLAERIDQPHETWSVAISRSMRALQLGRLAEAEELANTAMALGSESVPESMTAFGAQLIENSAGRRSVGRIGANG